MLDLFKDIIGSVNDKRENLFKADPEAAGKAYVPFVVNRYFSNSPSTVMFASELARYPDLDKRIQYDFYFYGLSKGRRFIQWIKKQAVEDQALLDAVCGLYDVSEVKARQYISFMTASEKNELLASQFKGGIK